MTHLEDIDGALKLMALALRYAFNLFYVLHVQRI
jgi:hypothetical protein